MDKIIEVISLEFPDKAKDISESLEIRNKTISSIIDDISSELN